MIGSSSGSAQFTSSDAKATVQTRTDRPPRRGVQRSSVTVRRPLLQWIRAWRRAAPERLEAIFPFERSAPRVPAEYQSLNTYLERRYASVVVLTFDQMEALLGFALPSASTELGWWTMAAMPMDRHSAAWTEAGRTATPNLRAKTVTFQRP